MGKWKAREAELRAMVMEGMSDPEIGDRFGVSRVAVYFARQSLGIPSGRLPGMKQQKRTPEPVELPQPEATYTEGGVTLKRYPARYAEGAGVQTVTARPRR